MASKGIRNQTSSARATPRSTYMPPSGKFHPPAARGASIGGVHSAGEAPRIARPNKR